MAMIRGISFILLLAGLAAARERPLPCCKCEDSGRSDDVICLSGKEMREHVNHIEPLETPRLDHHLNLAGIVVLEIRFESNGKVSCARAISGHAMAIASAMEAVRRWTFKPVVWRVVAKGGCGRITIKYRLGEQGNSTELQ